jgi:hypothetical protein
MPDVAMSSFAYSCITCACGPKGVGSLTPREEVGLASFTLGSLATAWGWNGQDFASV